MLKCFNELKVPLFFQPDSNNLLSFLIYNTSTSLYFCSSFIWVCVVKTPTKTRSICHPKMWTYWNQNYFALYTKLQVGMSVGNTLLHSQLRFNLSLQEYSFYRDEPKRACTHIGETSHLPKQGWGSILRYHRSLRRKDSTARPFIVWKSTQNDFVMGLIYTLSPGCTVICSNKLEGRAHRITQEQGESFWAQRHQLMLIFIRY